MLDLGPEAPTDLESSSSPRWQLISGRWVPRRLRHEARRDDAEAATEVTYEAELAKLAKTDDAPRPPGWKSRRWAAITTTRALVVGETGEQLGRSPPGVGPKLRLTTGGFENFCGQVKAIDEATGALIVIVKVFGRARDQR